MFKKQYRVSEVLAVLSLTLLLTLDMGFRLDAAPGGEIAVTTTSDEARTLFLEGRTLNENIRFDDARELFSKAIAKDPEFALAHLYRAFTATSAMDFQTHLKKAVELASTASEGERLLIEAVEANVANNPIKAIELCQELIAKFPGDKRAHQLLGGMYTGRDKDDEAIAHCKKAIEIDDDYAPAYNSLGYAYLEKEDYQKAEEAFKNYIRLIPNEANPHDSLADLYTKMGRYEDAIAHYEKAIELNPKFSISQRKIATNLVFMGKYDRARQALGKAKAMATTPTAKVTDMNHIAHSYVYESNLQQALTEFDEAIDFATDQSLPERVAGIHLQKCFVQIELGDLTEAEKSLAECRNVVKQSYLRPSLKDNFAKEALFQEAFITARRKDFADALTKADEYLILIKAGNDPQEVEKHHELLGHISFEKGEYSQAVEHFKKGAYEDVYMLYRFALAQSKAGDPVAAGELFRRVANWNESSLGYAVVRSQAIDALREMTAK